MQYDFKIYFIMATLNSHLELPNQYRLCFWNFYLNALYFLIANKIIYLAIHYYIHFAKKK